MDCSYPLTSIDLENDVERYLENINKVRLTKGWNIIHITPAFYNKDFSDLVGNCNIEKVNFWDSINQRWGYNSIESQQQVETLLDTRNNEDNLFMPLVIKVTESCSLGQSIASPPQLPNLPN